MTPGSLHRLVKKHFRLYLRTMIPVGLMMLIIAVVQHHFVLHINYDDIQPHMLVMTEDAASTFQLFSVDLQQRLNFL